MNLHNDHNVYILGAGFSREANLPLIHDFLIRMRDSHEWLVSQGRRREASAVQQVLEFRREAASAGYWTQLDLENIEELFSLAASSSSHLNDDIQIAIAATLEFCTVVGRTGRQMFDLGWADWQGTSSWLHKVENPSKDTLYVMEQYPYRVAKLLGMFGSGRPKGENTFITFNYDSLLEESLRALNEPYTYGFPSKTVNWASGATDSGEGIPVLKLHGSITWALPKKRGKKLTVFGSYSEVRQIEAAPQLIPPTWHKRFENQLSYVWKSAVDAIATATRVVLIGFSIPPTDTHFKYLLAAGLQKNISLRGIYCFDPAKERLEDRIRALCRQQYLEDGRIHVVGSTLFALTEGAQDLRMIGRGPPSMSNCGVE